MRKKREKTALSKLQPMKTAGVNCSDAKDHVLKSHQAYQESRLFERTGGFFVISSQFLILR